MDSKHLRFLLYFIILLEVKTELYSSTSHIEALQTTQEGVITQLDAMINKGKCKIKALKNLLNQFKEEYKIAKQDVSKYVGNPVNAFRLFKRLVIDLNSIQRILEERMIAFNRNNSLTYPTSADLDGAAESIAVLVETYHLNVTQLSEGFLNVTRRRVGKIEVYSETFTHMSREDCLELGKALHRTKRFEAGMYWLNEVIRKDNESTHSLDGGSIREDVLWHLHEAAHAQALHARKIQNIHANSLRETDSSHNNFNDVDLLMSQYGYISLENQKTGKPSSNDDEQNAVDAQRDFIMTGILCRGEIEVAHDVTKSLKCYYGAGPRPYSRLVGYKIEQFHVTPDIYMLYDVISDQDIRTLIHEALPELKRAKVSSGGVNFTSPLRICKIAYLGQSDTRRRLRQRISDITRMNLNQSEPLQIANYGIGGLFLPHVDYWMTESFVKSRGNRISTMLVYMSDVELGGATVFPRFNLTVYPVKGAALFWPNLDFTGHGDYSTIHAACPVLRGNKWVATQWINVRGQELEHPCRPCFKISKSFYI